MSASHPAPPSSSSASGVCSPRLPHTSTAACLSSQGEQGERAHLCVTLRGGGLKLFTQTTHLLLHTAHMYARAANVPQGVSGRCDGRTARCASTVHTVHTQHTAVLTSHIHTTHSSALAAALPHVPRASHGTRVRCITFIAAGPHPSVQTSQSQFDHVGGGSGQHGGKGQMRKSLPCGVDACTSSFEAVGGVQWQ